MKKVLKNKFKTNSFYYYANEYRKNITEEEEIEKIDMTDVFYREVELMIKENELINIQINGRVRLGKSTEAIQIGLHIFELLKKAGMRSKKDKFSIKNIARDDQEYSKIMRMEDTRFTVIVTDESNELEKGGENSSVEQQLQRVFSDVQAGRYVHRVSCAPKDIIDQNADIILEIVSVDKVKKVSHNKLYYRLAYGGSECIQLLGYVNIYVGDLINNWENKVKKVYFKARKDKKDEKIINYWLKKDFYVQYMMKKYEKMELITKEGIFRPRILDYAESMIEVIEKLKPLTRMTNIINQNIVRNYVKITSRKYKIPLSIIGEELASREIFALLDLYKGFHKISKDINGVDNQLAKGKMTITEHAFKLKDMQKMRDELFSAIKMQEDEYKRYSEIQKRYNKHLRNGSKKEKTVTT